MSGWDDPETAAYYEAFCRRHSRYNRANRELIRHARIALGMRVLDLGAGTGRTAEHALRCLGSDGRIVCVEPSAAMREAGMRRLADSRVAWSAAVPNAAGTFDVILCGASIWQMEPLAPTFPVLAGLLKPGGTLCFNIPALYLLEPDEPGGGSDPLLLTLPERLFAGSDRAFACQPMEPPTAAALSRRCIEEWLDAAGLRGESWSFRVRLTQDAYADWLKIPALTDRMLGGLTPQERARRIDAALEAADRSSWKWERWKGWTAWKG